MAAPAAFAFRLAGLLEFMDVIKEIMDLADRYSKMDPWWVASAAKYAEWLQERDPHWEEAYALFVYTAETEVDIVGLFMGEGNLAEQLAEQYARALRWTIYAHGLIDTTNYVGSIAIGPTEADAYEQSIRQLILPETSIDV